METRVKSLSHEVLIAEHRPTVLIGERINPTGTKNCPKHSNQETWISCGKKPSHNSMPEPIFWM